MPACCFTRTFILTTNLDILMVHLCIKKLLCCKSVLKSSFGKKEHPLGEKEFTLISYCREESKNLDSRRNTPCRSNLLQAISCSREVAGKKSEESGRGRQKQKKNGWSSVLDPLASYIFFALSVQAHLAGVVPHFW